MRNLGKLSIATLAVVLGLASAALAGATHGRSQSAPGHTRSQTTSSTGTTSTTSTTSGPGSKANAYGRACQGESKQHLAGQPGTPFSKCVTDMAHLANNPNANPHRACANESKKHVTGQKGTPYSQCVAAAAKLRGEQGHH